MILRKANKYRLQPTAEQAELMQRFAGCCRVVYNLALEQRRDHWRNYMSVNGKSITYVSQANELPALKTEFPWLKEAHSQILQQSLKDLDRAYQNFFSSRAGYPRPRRKGVHDSFRFPDGKSLLIQRTGCRSGRIKLPKLGWVRLRGWYDVPGQIRNATVSRKGEYWYVSVQWEKEVADPVSVNSSTLGLDRGITLFAACSDGTMVTPVNAGRKLAKKLKRVQRRLSRKKLGSSNWIKQKKRLTRLKKKEADIRRDFLHKTSTTIAKSHGTVVMEDLKVRNMTTSAKGTIDQPGRNVASKSGLNRSILDQGWHMFQSMLSYKLQERGAKLVLVPAHYTSQTCSVCGCVSADNRQSQSRFKCTSCGHEENADLNAAKNIRRQGVAHLPVEGDGCVPVETGTIPSAA